MTLLSHLGHALPRSPVDVLRRPPALRRPGGVHGTQATDGRPDVDPRVFAVQRLGAVGVGLFLSVFGILGATDGVGFLSTHGRRYLGMSSNGLLSARLAAGDRVSGALLGRRRGAVVPGAGSGPSR